MPKTGRPFAYGSKWKGGQYPSPPETALKAKKCPCPSPQTYRNEDGERRCLCGRAV